MHPLKMADSVPLDTALDLVPILGVRLKNVPAVLSEDVRLKLAEHVYSDVEVRDMELNNGSTVDSDAVFNFLLHCRKIETMSKSSRAVH